MSDSVDLVTEQLPDFNNEDHPNQMDVQYKDILNWIIETGMGTQDRTGVGRITQVGGYLSFEMDSGFPLPTVRGVPFKSPIAEMCGFIHGFTSADSFRMLGCNYWDKNANDPGKNNSNAWLTNPFREGKDHLGNVYGAQWRYWEDTRVVYAKDANYAAKVQSYKDRGYSLLVETQELVVFQKHIDQLAECVATIISNPDSRRILFHGWNPGALAEIALPACHLLYQFIPLEDKLNLVLYIRSSDTVLGLPSNVAGGAFLLHVISKLTGRIPDRLVVMTGDAHVYLNHLDGVAEFVDKPSSCAYNKDGKLVDLVYTGSDINLAKDYDPESESFVELTHRCTDALNKIHPSNWEVVNYEHQGKVDPDLLPMAV